MKINPFGKLRINAEQGRSIKNLKLKIILCLLVTCFLSLITTTPQAIASSLSLSVNPSIIEIQAIPPTAISTNITIYNKSDQESKLNIYHKPFKAYGEMGEPMFLNPQDSIFLSNIQVLDNEAPIDSITLAPSQQKKLTLKITVPQESKAQDHYFSIIFLTQNESQPITTTSLSALGIASNILLSIGPKDSPKPLLEEFSTNFFYEHGPVPFSIKIKNKGKHFLKPKGEILIKNMFGQNVGKIAIEELNVLSNSTRMIPASSSLWKEDFILGLYTANISLSFSGSDVHFNKSIHFFAFPYKNIGLIAVLIGFLLIVKAKLQAYRKS